MFRDSKEYDRLCLANDAFEAQSLATDIRTRQEQEREKCLTGASDKRAQEKRAAHNKTEIDKT